MTPDESRAVDLATKSLEHFKSNSRDDAVRLLREALSLAPQNPTVLSTFHALQADANTPAISKLIQACALNGEEAAGQDALRLLRDPNLSLPTDTAVECLQLLLARADNIPSPLGGKLVGGMLRASQAAREHVADKLRDDHDVVLGVLQRLGDDAIDGAATALLDMMAWKQDTQANLKGLQDCFRWFLSRLGPGEKELCMARSVARLLATRAEVLHSYINQAGLEQLLGLLDASAQRDLRSHATLAAAKFVEVSGEVGQSMIEKFMASRLTAEGDDDLRLAFSVAAAIFPLVPQFAAQLFLTEGFIEGLVPSLQARPEDVEAAALDMLSAACVDKTCRIAINKNCSDYLEALVKSSDAGKSTAAVILAKVKYTPGDEGQQVSQKDMDKLAEVFKGMILQPDVKIRDSSVEGLAYTSLKGSVKQALIQDKAFVKSLVQTLSTSMGKPTVMFGALTVVANLTAYTPVMSEEQRKVAELKNYAETKPKAKVGPDPADKNEMVTPRCKVLMDAGVVPALVSCSKKITPSAVVIVAGILLSLSKHQKHRGLIASQGGVKLALQLYSVASGASAQDLATRYTSAHALGRILVSVNPSHVFSSQLAISSAVRPLFTLLEDKDDQKDLLYLFEGLLALTNLASTEEDIRDQIIRVGWTRIEELLLHDNTMIQRATVELVCNLMATPTGVAKFADGSKAASNRLHILLALADAEDLATRRAAGGALAMLTEWDKASEAVAAKENGVKIVLGMVAEENDEMRHRGVVVVRNLVCGAVSHADKVKSEGGIDILKEALKGTRQPEVLQIGVEALKVLMAAG
ncbi:myosin-binding striated muscle assembly central-domain-containing protein [Sphaerosporella brunnea]|uniref:Myosin-binding striated muscle assembly central-domain-containing protein n=1 Tax=Sphaerosporella brunnea TaxID=1250544 RepID=A0A5J5EG62_9PEZI|nr:myosin-binding striated muscle assembly central-domain-containing protein [Sphaerosporella brunnea]